VNRFAYYTGGVLAFSALIPGRNQDEFGIAVATLELTYLAQFGSHLAVQPDLQLVMNPNTDPAIRNAVVFMLRLEVSF